MDTQTIKPGDLVRLTDPISNGLIVKIESVSEYGTASWFGGSQNHDMEQIPCEFEAYPIGDNSLKNYYETLSDVISDLESKIGIKLYPESGVEYWKRRAEIAEEQVKLAKHDFNVLLAAEEKLTVKYRKLSEIVKPIKDFEL